MTSTLSLSISPSEMPVLVAARIEISSAYCLRLFISSRNLGATIHFTLSLSDSNLPHVSITIFISSLLMLPATNTSAPSKPRLFLYSLSSLSVNESLFRSILRSPDKNILFSSTPRAVKPLIYMGDFTPIYENIL